jgi:hypothetical protein
MPLGAIRPRYVAAYTKEALAGELSPHAKPFAAKPVQLHLNLLYDVFKTARAEELVRRRRYRAAPPVEVSTDLSDLR